MVVVGTGVGSGPFAGVLFPSVLSWEEVVGSRGRFRDIPRS